MDWMCDQRAKTGKGMKWRSGLRMDMRVLLSEPTVETWNFAKVVHRKKKLEPYPLHNPGECLKPKTNLGVPNTRINYQYVSKNCPGGPQHPNSHAKTRFIHTTRCASVLFSSPIKVPRLWVANPGGNPLCSQPCLSHLGTPHNFTQLNKINIKKEGGKLRILDEFIQLIYHTAQALNWSRRWCGSRIAMSVFAGSLPINTKGYECTIMIPEVKGVHPASPATPE